MFHTNIFFLYILLTFSINAFGVVSETTSTLIKRHLALWEKEGNLPLCEGFPTKRNPDYPADDSRHICNDGDMSLFSGLLCAAGDKRGCEAVLAAKNEDGRWFRSPRRLKDPTIDEKEAIDGVASFSPDMALGVQLYLATTTDLKSANQWYEWLDKNRPCWMFTEPNCGLPSNINDILEQLLKSKSARLENVRGWPRFCRDDVKQKGCTIRPSDLAILQETRMSLGIKSYDAQECHGENPTDIFDIKYWASMFNLENIAKKGFFKLLDINCMKAGSWVATGAFLNKPGFSQHLVGVEIFLAKKLGIKDPLQDQAIKILVEKQPKNPFFNYLLEGPTDKVADLVLEQCPATQDEIDKSLKHQWAWERNDTENASKNSSLWDCVFMAKLLEN